MFDVLIVGGGPVGACAGALLRVSAPALNVAILEPHTPPPATAAADARVVALSRASERLLRHAGAWRQLAAGRLCPYQRMRIWHESVASDSAAALVFDAADVGEPNLGYIVENRLLQGALLASFAQAGGDIETAALTGLAIGADRVVVTTSRGELEARLVVGADGAHSAVRSGAGLTATTTPYDQSAIVATVATQLPHQATAWQRFMKSGTLAFLPLASGDSSIVWSADEALAAELWRHERCRLRRSPRTGLRPGARRHAPGGRARDVSALQTGSAALRRRARRAHRRCGARGASARRRRA